MVNEKLDKFVNDLAAAVEYSQRAVDNRLPISVSAPMRERCLHEIMSLFMMHNAPEEKHEARHCERCRAEAYQWALYALGWDDRVTPRPSTAKERMAMLKEQMDEAFAILQGYGAHGD